MIGRIVHSKVPVSLVGGGNLDPTDLDLALDRAPWLVAADGGAGAALAAGHVPEVVIGDLDSLQPNDRDRLGARSERADGGEKKGDPADAEPNSRARARAVKAGVRRSRFKWDDVMLETGVFTRLSHLVPAEAAHDTATWEAMASEGFDGRVVCGVGAHRSVLENRIGTAARSAGYLASAQQRKPT